LKVIRNFFSVFNFRLYDKNSESDYSFFLHQNQNIFLSNIGNQKASTAPDLCPLLDFTLESENPVLNRVVQQVTLPEWFVIFLFSKRMPAA
jgi:hypothetical protein